MRAIYSAWDQLAPNPMSLRRSVSVAFVAAAIGATSSSSVTFYLASPAGNDKNGPLISPVAAIVRNPAPDAGAAVVQGQMKSEQIPAAGSTTEDLSKRNNAISPSDPGQQRSTGLQFEQPLRDVDRPAIHQKTYWRRAFRRFGTPNHW
jgi:hypothetical protein